MARGSADSCYIHADTIAWESILHDEHNQPTASVDSPSPDPVSDAQSAALGGDENEPSAEDRPAVAASAVAKLTSARMPADRGISSLGLLMQLGGVLGIVFAGVVSVSMARFGIGSATGAFFLVAALSVIRSTYLRTAGTRLLYGTGSEPVRAVRTYLAVAFAHTAISLAILHSYLDTEQLLHVGAFFSAWPLAMVAFFSFSQVKDLIADGVPHAEDYGFEGAAVLMTLFGIMGTLFSAWLLHRLLGDIDAAFATPASGIVVLVAGALFARSAVHTLAGLNGISGASFEECNASAGRYYSFGIVSSICIGVTLFVVILMSVQHMGAALMAGGIITPLLLAWPQILRRLYSERNYHVYLEDSKAQTYQRAPDAGLIALGWTLVALALFGLSQSLVDALFGGGLTNREIHELAAMVGPDAVEHLTRSDWWSVGVGGLQLWAGVELIRMSTRHKLAAMIYAVVSIAVVIYLVWPAIDSFDQIFQNVLDGGSQIRDMMMLATGFPLILAIGTVVLVNRVTVPSAVVHVRKSRIDSPAS